MPPDDDSSTYADMIRPLQYYTTLSNSTGTSTTWETGGSWMTNYPATFWAQDTSNSVYYTYEYQVDEFYEYYHGHVPFDNYLFTKGGRMHITLRTKSVMRLRTLEQFIVRTTYNFCEAYGIEHKLAKNSLRLSYEHEDVNMVLSAAGKDITVRAYYREEEPSEELQGLIATMFGVFLAAFDENAKLDYEVVWEESDLVDSALVQRVGKQGYIRLHKKNPENYPLASPAVAAPKAE